jgi:hypothetical protein
MQLIHILHFCERNQVLYKPQEEKNPKESNLENEGQEMGPPLLSMLRNLPVGEGTNTTGLVRAPLKCCAYLFHIVLGTIWLGSPCCCRMLPVSFRHFVPSHCISLKWVLFGLGIPD